MQTRAYRMHQFPNHPTLNNPLISSNVRYISGYLLWLNGQLHWVSKWQKITTRSLTEAKVYIIDKCIKAAYGMGIQYSDNIESPNAIS